MPEYGVKGSPPSNVEPHDWLYCSSLFLPMANPFRIDFSSSAVHPIEVEDALLTEWAVFSGR